MSNIIPPASLTRSRIAVGVFFFISGLRFATWASRIPDIQNHLHLSDAGLGTVLFALPAGSMAGLPVSGYLVSKYGSRIILYISAMVFPLFILGIGLAGTPWLLALNLFFFGFSSNLLNISVNTQAVALEQLYGKSIMASFHGLWSLGGFCGAAFGTLMVAEHTEVFYHFIIVAALSVLVTQFAFSNTVKQTKAQHKNTSLFVKPDRYLLTLGIIAFSTMATEGTMFDWSGVYFKKIVLAPAQLTTLGYVAFMLTMAGGRFLGDRLITNYGAKQVLRFSGAIIFMGLMTAVLLPNIIAATLGFLFVGFGVASVVPLCYALAGKSATMQPGMAIAAVSSIGFLGFLMGPPLIGYIARAFSLRISFALIAVFGGMMSVMAGKVKT